MLYQCALLRLFPQTVLIFLNDPCSSDMIPTKYWDALRKIYKILEIVPQSLRFSPKIYECFTVLYLFSISRINPKWHLNKDMQSPFQSIYPRPPPSSTRWAFFLLVGWKFSLCYMWYSPFQQLYHLNSIESNPLHLAPGT